MKMPDLFYFGADYYPEQWPEENWVEDARLMKAAGLNVVRLAEFAWVKMEPREDCFDFDWLDRVIAVLSAQGIRVVLGTPTASPPAWLMSIQSDLYLVDVNGFRQSYGNRREYCPTHPLYRKRAQAIVTRMAEHYKDNPAVIGWQIDNELGGRCYCDTCRAEFQRWLEKRYRTLERLNDCWGTIFWSQTYTDWAQIPVPTGSLPHNPGLALDYRRFQSDAYRDFQKLQVDIIRPHCPNHFITHNLMGFGYNQLNYFDLAADLDHVSWDIYPRHQWDLRASLDPARAALSGDAMRGLKKENYWVIEQQSGGGGWELMGPNPRPGELRLWTYQSIAHGADGILYFRWRTARFGIEQHWFGILDSHGTPGRRYEEVCRVGQELHRVGDLIVGSQVKARAAIMQSYDSRFAFQAQPNHPQFGYEAQVEDIYRGFFHHHVPVDLISERDDLSSYRLVIVPSLYILTEQTANSLEAFAANGGVVMLTTRTGVKDRYNTTINTRLPGLASRWCGMEIDEQISMPTDQGNEIRCELSDFEETYVTRAIADVIEPLGAQVLAWHTHDYYAGKPAATIHAVGKGKVVYLGFLSEPRFYDDLAGWMCQLAGIEPVFAGSEGVEIAERWQGDQKILFILNHTTQVQNLTLDARYINLFDNEVITGQVSVEPQDVLLLTPADREGW